MDDKRDQSSPSPTKLKARRPTTVGAAVFVGYFVGGVGLMTAFDRLQAAAHWEHRHRASYLFNHGSAVASPGYLYAYGVIDLVIGILLVLGASRASKGVTNAILAVGFLATDGVAISNFWSGSSLLDVLIMMVIPTVMLALLLSPSSRKFYARQSQ